MTIKCQEQHHNTWIIVMAWLDPYTGLLKHIVDHWMAVDQPRAHIAEMLALKTIEEPLNGLSTNQGDHKRSQHHCWHYCWETAQPNMYTCSALNLLLHPFLLKFGPHVFDICESSTTFKAFIPSYKPVSSQIRVLLKHVEEVWKENGKK